MKYQSIVELKAAYVRLCSPFKPSEHWRARLDKLALRLQETLKKGSNETNYYCYVYLDPRHEGKFKYVLPSGRVVTFKNKPFYVGKGHGHRHKAHIKEAEDFSKDSYKLRLIRKLMRNGHEPIIIQTLRRYDEFTAYAIEIDLILGIGRRNTGEGPLTNNTSGGEGASGAIHSKESSIKKSIALKGRKKPEGFGAKVSKAQKGKIVSEETRAKLRNRTTKEETRAKMSATRKGIPKSDEYKAKLSSVMKGIPKPKEFSAKVSNALTGVKHSVERVAARKARNQLRRETMPKIKCPHCSTESHNQANMTRWHFAKCSSA